MGDGQIEYKIIEFHKGQTIFKEGRKGSCAYLIRSGVVNVYKTINNKKVSLTRMTAGQILGEMSVINRETRSASAEALEFCELIQINEATLRQALSQSIPIVKGMTKQLIRRCREKDEKVCEQMTGNIFLSVCHLIDLILSREPNIYYSDMSETIRNILNVPQIKIDSITKKLCNLQLLTIAPAHSHNENIVSMTDPERFLKGAVAFDKELGQPCEQEDEYIDIFEFAAMVNCRPSVILEKIGNRSIPKSLVFLSKNGAMAWIEEAGTIRF